MAYVKFGRLSDVQFIHQEKCWKSLFKTVFKSYGSFIRNVVTGKMFATISSDKRKRKVWFFVIMLPSMIILF